MASRILARVRQDADRLFLSISLSVQNYTSRMTTVAGRPIPYPLEDKIDPAVRVCATELARQAGLAEYVRSVQLYKSMGYSSADDYAAAAWFTHLKPARYIVEAMRAAGLRITLAS